MSTARMAEFLEPTTGVAVVVDGGGGDGGGGVFGLDSLISQELILFRFLFLLLYSRVITN